MANSSVETDMHGVSTPATPSFVTEAAAIVSDLVALRRALHAEPEVGLHLPHTQRGVLTALHGLGLEIHQGTRTTSVVAVLRGGRPGPVVLLRGDMDALPIPEETGLNFASKNGNMHACGHDLHTAALVGAARLLSAHRQQLPGTVVFMFQPGEEDEWGGARIMMDEGVLEAAGERPIAAYAIHVVPGPYGVFTTRPGAMLAGCSTLKITVRGRAGHASQPHRVLDPVPVAAQIIVALQTYVTRTFDVMDPVVISVTQVRTPPGPLTVTPGLIQLEGTVRTFSQSAVDTLQRDLPVLIEGIAAAHRCGGEVTLTVTEPVTVNDTASTTQVMDCLRSTFGEHRVKVMPTPQMGSEDFAHVLHEIPGTFIALTASPVGIDAATTEYNHSPRVIFDDTILADQAAALATIAFSRLQDTSHAVA
ncbi:peptidase M20D, amidohydrolase [Mycobacteroides abscessus subsp. bolletii]|uniref:M20 metallopeptidase family protein n=1 Tax=Mycobacteroides abscessus TaxID=36809 RepID=UPI000927A82B|nr:M20 family metallopeptidase [Mycobacteroides abscessus]SIJ06676.1 peptidase M20D, amidohydrolase [Mycobacteroides abscessus subsp. bolletii]SLD79148.1 peptidase M20D, amidohydrolase [Mycobacteroides abscessus subsp. bolletii]SLD86323.1 peptidase M20D, amidohydrolase [Mycobacteroides abscessus subsp. bolletii]